MSYACLCLATIDQYFATCTSPRWQQWSNITIAHWLAIISYYFNYDCDSLFNTFISMTVRTGEITCTMNNIIAVQNRNYFVVLFLSGYIPDFITVLFGIF
jgi:hypothetical protein